MGQAQDLAGQIFGRWTVKEFVGFRSRKPVWLCLCECGAMREVDTYSLQTGKSQSCGCLQRERVSSVRSAAAKQERGADSHAFKHGQTRPGWKSPTYVSWQCVIDRCTNPTRLFWKQYGGAGIQVCDRWMIFENFLLDLGERPKGTTLGRFKDRGNYEPGNCAWQTKKEQIAEHYLKKSLVVAA